VRISTAIAALVFMACTPARAGFSWEKDFGPMIPVTTEEGQRLLAEVEPIAVNLPALRESWVAQLPSHCGAASAVMVINALQPGLGLTQDSLFTPETASIVTQDVVYQIGFTNDQLVAMIEATSDLTAANFRAGPASDEHSAEEFIQALTADNADPNSAVIVQFAYHWLTSQENTAGHFIPVGGYLPDRELVLLLEVFTQRPMVWVDARELYAAMALPDSTDGRNRGWIVVRRP
jgi:glutathione gamma-glutamylcysteinyltransferase